MKDYLEYEGYQNVAGSRTATKEAFNKGLLTRGQVWMDMIESRTNTMHTYNENILEVEFKNIVNNYFHLFSEFQTKMNSLL